MQFSEPFGNVFVRINAAFQSAGLLCGDAGASALWQRQKDTKTKQNTPTILRARTAKYPPAFEKAP